MPYLLQAISRDFAFCSWHFGRQTDGLIWVVDSADRGRLQDCKRELHDLLGQEVSAFVCLPIHVHQKKGTTSVEPCSRNVRTRKTYAQSCKHQFTKATAAGTRHGTCKVG